MRSRAILLWLWFGFVVVSTLLVFISAGSTHPRGDPTELIVVYLLVPALFTALGGVIATKQPGNRIATLFLVIGAAVLLSIWADFNTSWTPPSSPTLADALAVVWFDAGFQIGLFIPLGLLLHIFPTGHLLGPRWGWVGWAAGISAFTSLFAEISVTEVSPNFAPGNELWVIPNPVGFFETGTMGNPVYASILGVTFLPLIFGGVASIITRYRRSDPTVRAQIRWVVYSLILFVLFGVAPASVGFYGAGLALTLLLVPVSVTIAITRYRLFDIDRLISRTVGYVVVVGALGALFAVLTTLPGLLIGGANEDGSQAAAPPLLVAAATLVVAGLFNPFRRRVLRWVDRRFNRSRYQAEHVTSELVTVLADVVTPEQVGSHWVEAVEHALEPKMIGVWVRDS